LRWVSGKRRSVTGALFQRLQQRAQQPGLGALALRGAEHYEVSSPAHEDAVLLRTGEGRLQVVPAATQRQRAKAGLLRSLLQPLK
jgi:hypothetical protein